MQERFKGAAIVNWLEKWLIEHPDITRYRISKDTGINERYLKKIIDNDIKLENLKYWQTVAITDFFKKVENESRCEVEIAECEVLKDLSHAMDNIRISMNKLENKIVDYMIIGTSSELVSFSDRMEDLITQYRNIQKEYDSVVSSIKNVYAIEMNKK